MSERDPKTGRFPPRPNKPAGGAGWGGDAKGDRGRDRLVPGARTRETIANRAARAAEMEDVLYNIATSGEVEANRLNAAYKLKTLVDGLPVATQVRVDGGDLADWTDEELARAANELRSRIAGEDRGGTGEAGSAEPPGDVPPVH